MRVPVAVQCKDNEHKSMHVTNWKCSITISITSLKTTTGVHIILSYVYACNGNLHKYTINISQIWFSLKTYIKVHKNSR